MYNVGMSDVHGGQRKVLNSLELGLRMVVNHLVVGSKRRPSVRTSSALNAGPAHKPNSK